MTDSMVPIIRQMHEAETDADRARLLLNVPDGVLAKYAGVFAAACRRAGFVGGESYVALRVSAFAAVRDDMGNLPRPLTLALKDARTELVAVLGRLGATDG
jgi:hypothetical protein